MRSTRCTLVLAALLVTAWTVSARQAGPPAAPAGQPPVTFRVDVNYVEIDAVVTDAQGNLVRDLTRDDFRLAEEGRPQTIAAFTRVDLPIERPDPPLFLSRTIEPDVRSNRDEFNGRVFLLVLDDLQTDVRRTALVRAGARQFIQKYVGANDMVAIVNTGGGVAATQEFTSSRPRLLAAVDRFMGRKMPSTTLAMLDDYYRQRAMASGQAARDTGEQERSYFARNTLASLRSLAEYLAGIRGRRKAIVWFGEGIDYDIGNPFQAPAASEIRRDMEEVIAAATRANVSVYGVDPRGLGAGLDEAVDIPSLPDDPTLNLGAMSVQNEVRRAQDSLRTISSETGGFAIVNQNDLNAEFSRMVRENSGYYLLGYYPTDDRKDGRFRRVQVTVARPGVTVRARKGYVAAKGRPASRPVSPAEAATSPAMRDALNSPVPASGVTLNVFAAPFMGRTPSKASLAIIMEIDPGSLRFVEKNGVFTEDLEIVIIASDASGKIQDGARDQVPLRLGARTHQLVSRDGFRVTRRLDLAPGRYQLRIAAREANAGAVGSLAYDVDVPDFSKGPLLMSGIAVSSAFGARVQTANPDPEFKDVLPASPVAIRDFPRGDTLSVFAEIYDNLRATAHRVSIKTTILADDGSVVFSADDERRSEELGGSTGAYGHARTMSLKDVPAGRYVLRIEARALLSNGGTTSRELEFRVR